MKNLMKLFFVLAAAITFATGGAKADAATVTTEKAGLTIAAAEQTAYKNKKTVSTTVKVVCNSKSKIKSMVSTISYKASKALTSSTSTKHDPLKIANYFDESTMKIGSFGTVTWKNKVLTVKLSVDGTGSSFRYYYGEAVYLRWNVKSLNEYIEAANVQNEKDKAWAVMGWLTEHTSYTKNNATTSYTERYINARAFCGNYKTLATIYARYAGYVGLTAGTKQFLPSSDILDDYVKIDGTWYVLEYYCYSSLNQEYTDITSGAMSESGIQELYAQQEAGKYSRGDAAELTVGEYCLMTEDTWNSYRKTIVGG